MKNPVTVSALIEKVLMICFIGASSLLADTRYETLTTEGTPEVFLSPTDVVEIVGATGGNQSGPNASLYFATGEQVSVIFRNTNQNRFPIKPSSFIFTGLSRISVSQFGAITLKITTENSGIVTLTESNRTALINPTDVVEIIGASGSVESGPNITLRFQGENDSQYGIQFNSSSEHAHIKPQHFIFTRLSSVELNTNYLGAVTLRVTPQGGPVTPTEKVVSFEERLATTEAVAAANVNAVVSNGTSIQDNAAAIAVNGTNIQTNAADISVNGTNIQDIATSVQDNATGIAANVAAIAVNGTNTLNNATAIAGNGTNIQDNANTISVNGTNIQDNANTISVNGMNIQENATGIATNVTAIAGNGTTIAANSELIRLINLALQASEIERGRIALDIARLELSLQTLDNQISLLGSNAAFLGELGEEFATKADLTTTINEGKTQGINAVTSDPNNWNVFTADQIQEMAVDDLVLTREENGDFVLNYEIQQSDNAIDWTTYSAQAETITGLPVNKAFVRIRTR